VALAGIIGAIVLIQLLLAGLLYVVSWIMEIRMPEEEEERRAGEEMEREPSQKATQDGPYSGNSGVSHALNPLELSVQYERRFERLSEDSSELPYRISTHERCPDPCPQIREVVMDHPDFEFIGTRGPFIDTGDDEIEIATGHREVHIFLREYFFDEEGYSFPTE